MLEIEKKIVSTVKYEGDRNKYNFKVKNLSYERVEEEIETDSIGATLDYSAVWNDGITLKSQILLSHNDIEYENLVANGLKRTVSYDIKLRTKSINEVVDKIYREFRLRDWETSILGLGDDEVYSKDNLPPKEKLEKIIRKSMDKAGIKGDLLIEDNTNKIFTAFSTLFRTRSKTVVNKIKSTEFITIKTEDMNDESRGISSFRSDASLFYSSEYEKEIKEEQKQIVEEFLEDESFPRKAQTEVNIYDFKTPLNFVIATANPEYTFIKKYLIKNENAQAIKAWIKSRDIGFYSIEYSYKIGSHTKQGSFNPDFIIKLNNEKDIYIVLEIKENGDDSVENKGKNRAAMAHFELLNSKLKEAGFDEKYYFHFLSPDDYEVFFEYLRDNKLDSFVSGLDTLLNE